jgi:nucleotide-binding universal stress UspA family protein
MMTRILVAVDDSPPAMMAATYAIELAKSQGAELHLVAVSEPARHAKQALDHLTNLARKASVPATSTTTNGGHPFDVLLAVAKEWGADLIIMGRSDNRRPGVPYVGSQTEHLLEFTDIPVLVVPFPAREAAST